MNENGGSGNSRDLEKKIALLERKLKEARLQAVKTASHFGNERRALEGLIRLKEEDFRDYERLLKASQNRCDRLQDEIRVYRKEMLKRHNERVADQVAISNLRAKNADLIATLQSFYAGTQQTREFAEPPADTGTDIAL